MAKYRKRPIIVDAEQWIPSFDWKTMQGGYIPDGCRGPFHSLIGSKIFLTIETPEGDMMVDPMDWIITGINGERYPCKPDIFAATYDKVEDETNAIE